MWGYIAVWVIAIVVGVMMIPKPPRSAASPPGNLDIPVAESGKPIPVLFGTRIVRQLNVVWYGDVKTRPIHQSSGGK